MCLRLCLQFEFNETLIVMSAPQCSLHCQTTFSRRSSFREGVKRLGEALRYSPALAHTYKQHCVKPLTAFPYIVALQWSVCNVLSVYSRAL